MNPGGMKRQEGAAGGAEHAARFSPRVRFAVILGCAALVLFVVAEVASRLLERAAKPAPLAATAPPAVTPVPVPVPASEADAREQYRQYALAIERALASPDPRVRETAFNA